MITSNLNHVVACLCGGALLFGLWGCKPKTEGGKEANSQAAPSEPTLAKYILAKDAQAKQIAAAEKLPIPPAVWDLFQAMGKGDSATFTNLWARVLKMSGQYGGQKPDPGLTNEVWPILLDASGAYIEAMNWDKELLRQYARDIIQSIPPGSVYFGGSDPGRFAVSAFCESQIEGRPFFTLTQHGLMEGRYQKYLRRIYGKKLRLPDDEDSRKIWEQNKERSQRPEAYWAALGAFSQFVFDQNPDRQFYCEEGRMTMDWMYPHLVPNGLIAKIQKESPAELSEKELKGDREFWTSYCVPLIGDWVQETTPFKELCDFAEKTYLRHDLAGFKGNRQFAHGREAQNAFGELRCFIAKIYAWRINHTSSTDVQKRLLREAHLAFRQAYALGSANPQVLYALVNFLANIQQLEDALLVTQTALKLDPANTIIKQLASDIEKIRQTTPPPVGK